MSGGKFYELHRRDQDPMYQFAEPLTEAVIVDRPNRFIMIVDVGGIITKAHCPSTGKIGSVRLAGLPVLLSHHNIGHGRKMEWTVEAISYNDPTDEHKEWIGINQGASNRYVRYFLEQNRMPDLINVEYDYDVEREKQLGDSRIDLKVGDTYIEVKTPVQVIEKRVPDHVQVIKHPHKFSGGDRLVKHITQLGSALESHERCVMLTCYQYVPDDGEDLDRYDYGELYEDVDRIVAAFDRARAAGVEQWSCEMRLTPAGVRLVNYHREDV